MSTEGGTRAVITAMTANGGIAVTKFLAFGATGSSEAYSFRTALREANRSRGSRSLMRYVRDARQPELPVVLLEDAGERTADGGDPD